MEMEYYIIKMVILKVKENGLIVKWKDMENVFMKMESIIR